MDVTAPPPVTYPAELPITAVVGEVRQAIRDNQVVIIAGETGSGKTTQIPKICLELGRTRIGHTQPRRIAARTVAERIAEELGTELGSTVGYKVRFTDRSGDATMVKLMTDGILLAEIQRDRDLRRYDTLIIDEAHERSLNIDFILGYLKRLLPRRPDLKVIITSATIDPERFAEHFSGAPALEVSGRTYPVEVRYRPVVDPDRPEQEERDQAQAIVDAVDELVREGPGDVLVFLSGEREIRDAADALAGKTDRYGAAVEVLPLYGRLSAAEQHRVFESHRGRRVVLATNVAETSLTVPGIKYVVDPGTARISRYSNRTKVQRLPIEPISQASADQRKGRCGRTSDGICIRLYSEEDFESRPPFTDPEILRTNLASVILQMAALDLGDVGAFPFIDPPDKRNISDGVRLLEELGAFRQGVKGGPEARPGVLTELGRKLARLPVDPRLGRMVIEADRNGCAGEVLVIAAALAIQDPRERPTDAQQAADEKHRRFADPTSDFLAYLNLWNYLRERQNELSSSAFRRMCKSEFLHYLRVREWQDLHAQLRRLAADLGVTPNKAPADPARVHTALLAGLLSHIGMKDPEAKGRGPAEFIGARGTRFAVFPGSGLAKKPPAWVVAAELVETSRLWARMVARIEPEWVEPLAEHLVRRTYSEPHWSKRRGSVVAVEKVTLYGVPIVADRRINYGRIDPVMSRELFIRHALVEGDWETRHRFFHENRRLLEEAEELEHRARRRDIVVDDDTLFDFYDRRIPEKVVSGRHFDTWWKSERRQKPDLLTFTSADLVNDGAAAVTEDDYPDVWTSGPASMPLSYQFEPGAATDGVTIDVPLDTLNQLDAADFGWQVPGLRQELVTELIRSLPKPLRRSFVPAPDAARAVLPRLAAAADGGGRSRDLLDSLSLELERLRGVRVPREAWDTSRLPDHLRITFRVTDGDRVLGTGKDLDELKRRLRPKVRATLAAAAGDLTRTGLTTWDFGELPPVFSDGRVRAFPALVDRGSSVDIRLFDTEPVARAAMWAGARRLVLLNVPSPVKSIAAGLSNNAKLALSHNPHGGVAALMADCVSCASDHLIASAGGVPWNAEEFAKVRDAVRASLYDVTAEVVRQVERALTVANRVEPRVRDTRSLPLVPSLTDIRAQLSALVFPGFATATGVTRLPHLVRYLTAIERRLDKLPENPNRDRQQMEIVHRVVEAYERVPESRRSEPDVVAVRWMIEELRVSLFAQTLGTPAPVSEKRIMSALDVLR